MDEPSSNLDAGSILDLRKILAFWKSQGKQLLYQNIGFIISVVWRIGLFTLQLDKWKGIILRQNLSNLRSSKAPIWDCAPLFLKICCLRNIYRKLETNALALHNFRFAYKNEPETLHIMDCEIPTNRIVGIIGNNGAGKSTFSRCFCGLEKRCGRLSGTEENTVRKTG